MRRRRFLLFGGDRFYPLGGFFDLQGDFQTVEEAVTKATRRGWDWWHIYDLKRNEIVLGGGREG